MAPSTLLACLLGLICSSLTAALPGVFDVASFGGVGDGVTLNTRAFAAALAAAHAYYAASGTPGTVLAGPGRWLSGQLVLLSGVTLRIAPGATLLASANASDYPAAQAQWAFLYSSNAVDLAITGGGIVDGQFQRYIGGFVEAWDEFIPVGWPGCSGECRPRLAMLTNSQRITVSSVTFTGSPDWTFHLLNCSYVHVYNWTQHGDERWPNNDGIDIDSSSHVLLENSTIDTADDGVCIKGSTPGGASTNVTVRNCSIRSRSSAVKFGSNCPIPFSSYLFEDLYIHDSNRGLALQARDGGLITDTVFRRIVINGTRFWPWKWWGDGGPIYISSMTRTATDPGTVVQNVLFEDISAVSENAIVLSGARPGRPLHNITLRRISLLLSKRGNYSVSAGQSGPSIEYDPHPPGVPGRVSLAGWMPGLYAEGVVGLTLADVSVAFDRQQPQPYWGTVCLNTSAAGAPVTVLGGSCTLPAAVGGAGAGAAGGAVARAADGAPALPAAPTAVTISNTALRTTVSGATVLAQDGNLANALTPAGEFVLVGMSYGLCPYVGCANESLGACGFGAGRILVYTSPTLADGSWAEGVEVLPAAQRPGNAIYFRPHLVFNPSTQAWVLWVRWLPYKSPSLAQDSTLYLVASAPHPTGPFTIVNANVSMFYANSADDNLYVAPDGSGYLVHTARSTGTRLVVERLAPDFYSSLGAHDPAARSAQIGAGGMEAPALWSTGPQEWWVSGSPLCCYCRSGSPPTVFFSSAGPLGPYAAVGPSLGNAPGGQQNFVFQHARLGAQVLVGFNRWGSDPGPAPALFDNSLQYWALLQRQGAGWAPLAWQDNVTVLVT